jgi:hypothetical protein
VLVSRAVAMRDSCRQTAGSNKNPALELAAFLAAGALEGHDKLLLIGTKTLRATTYRWQQSGVPTISIEMNTAEKLGVELFTWEIATALAYARLSVNPFDEPDAQEGRGKVTDMLETLAIKREGPARTVRVREKGIELYAEAETRQQTSTWNLFEALRTFLDARKPDGYLVVIYDCG